EKLGLGRYVLVAAGSYAHVQLATGISIFGGYDPTNWSRRSALLETSIAGAPEGVLADAAIRVTLQYVTVHGDSNGAGLPTAYGIRAINGSALTLQNVSVSAGNGAAGLAGARGIRGTDGAIADPGEQGSCDLDLGGRGGMGGGSAARRYGGD